MKAMTSLHSCLVVILKLKTKQRGKKVLKEPTAFLLKQVTSSSVSLKES